MFAEIAVLASCYKVLCERRPSFGLRPDVINIQKHAGRLATTIHASEAVSM
jgi:hypothetical protein